LSVKLIFNFLRKSLRIRTITNMNDKILAALASATNDNKELTRRRFPRRVKDICVADINGTTYPVQDWSQCGVLFTADGRAFEAGKDCAVVMKFKLADVVTEIPVTGVIVRASTKQVAVEFVDMTKKIEKAFAQVIEDSIAQDKIAEAEQLG